jgi:hypothetical protein
MAIDSPVPTSLSQPGDSEALPTKHRRKLPSRFCEPGLEMHHKALIDILPQPVPALPPPGVEFTPSASPAIAMSLELYSGDRTAAPDSENCCPLRRVLNTTRNSFGLFRRYHAENFPCHDPEGEADISSLSNIVDAASSQTNTIPSFGPYPNKSSFQLGEWYWNHGVRKSQEDFKGLLSIIGDDDFRPAEVRAANWAKINDHLAVNDLDDEEWIDEDAGWSSSSVPIQVPFHRFTDHPGTRDYMVANFHHRSLVSVIRDKIKNQSDHPHFHYEPYQLIWQPTDDREEVHIHGELYTSPSFIDAHNDLQNSPGEPGCTLPRVVVALMFWSDATHLTNFGNTKLWPLYMFFGNESKYRRCRPSCNLCEHVAYFESVRCLNFLFFIFRD